jgi:drug/metabolite transporter (DMT)-like permease
LAWNFNRYDFDFRRVKLFTLVTNPKAILRFLKMTDKIKPADSMFNQFKLSIYYPVLVLVISMLCISLNHVIGRGVHLEVPPVGLGFWRCFVASLILLPIIWPNRVYLISTIRSHFRVLVVVGIILTVSTTSVLIALHFTTATNAAMINSTQPIITIILAWLFLNEQLERQQKFGVLLGFMGVMVMISKGDFHKLINVDYNLGDLISLAAMIGLAVYSIKLKSLVDKFTAVELLFSILTVGTLFLLPFYIIETIYYHPVIISPASLSSIFGMAIFVMVLGILAWNIGIQLVGPSMASIFLNLIPVFGAVLSMIFLGEQFHFYHFICFVFIFAGMLMVLRRSLQNLKPVNKARG